MRLCLIYLYSLWVSFVFIFHPLSMIPLKSLEREGERDTQTLEHAKQTTFLPIQQQQLLEIDHQHNILIKNIL